MSHLQVLHAADGIVAEVQDAQARGRGQPLRQSAHAAVVQAQLVQRGKAIQAACGTTCLLSNFVICSLSIIAGALARV